ncbi:NAD(P)/FAD-dependent oxidoreductase [Janibacter sp. GXQ6167]|uniref:NAD(P)/FAD-dependent oxidoreductase n=1 Tax=Janibacter sp. GXQ6167 TaxID=3240791 RepID=UPI003524936B
MDVVVIGAGVVGLTTAYELAEAGHRVQVIARDDPRETVSALAGGLWFPYHAAPREVIHGWGLTSLDRFVALAAHPDTGVRIARGVMAESDPDPWWRAGLTGVREAREEERPAGAPFAFVAHLPLVTTTIHLTWLMARLAEKGVPVRRGEVRSLSEAPGADVIVVAAGLGSADLVPGTGLAPSRGQIVRLANPGLSDWLVDAERPDGLTYVLPHGDYVVCGGTDIEGTWDTEVDPETEAQILARARAAIPALAHAPVLSSAVGLRPVAPRVRLERALIDGRDVVLNLGHGGAGVTLSWGCAAAVASLLA